MAEQQPKMNWFLYFSVLSVNILTLCSGVCFSWTSPVLPKITSVDLSINPIGRPITISESAWIVSLMSVGLICSSPITIILSRFFSKKTILLLISLPLLAAHIILTFADKVYLLMVARLLMGITTGAGWAVMPTFVAEIAEDKNRGALGTLAGVMASIGTFLNYLLGPYMSMRTFSILNLIPLSAFCILYGFFVPNSPYDLIIQDQPDKAKQSLIKLRRTSKIEKEMAYIDGFVKSSNTGRGFLDLFKDEVLRKILKICSALMVFQQLAGIIAVVSYTETIFSLSGSAIPSDISSIIIGCVSIVSVSISGRLTDTKGRKVLLTTSCTLIFLSLFTLSSYFALQSYQFDLSGVSWLPIASLILYMFSFNLGLAIIPWIILGEVFPPDVKAAASTVIALVNFLSTFAVNISFPYLMAYIGISGAFGLFGLFTVMAAIYCVVVLPETKGKSFQEIQLMFNAKS